VYVIIVDAVLQLENDDRYMARYKDCASSKINRQPLSTLKYNNYWFDGTLALAVAAAE
jgi:hypothetical protein